MIKNDFVNLNPLCSLSFPLSVIPSDPHLVVLRSNNAILLNLALVHIAQRRHHFEGGSRGLGSEALDDVVFVGNDT